MHYRQMMPQSSPNYPYNPFIERNDDDTLLPSGNDDTVSASKHDRSRGDLSNRTFDG